MGQTTELFEQLLKKDMDLTKLQIPDDFYQTLLEELLARDYLSDASKRSFLNFFRKDQEKVKKDQRINWLQITRLPIHPNDRESYDLLSRWQGVLSSLHAWGYRLYFLLLRHDGKTKLFIGTVSPSKVINTGDAIEQIREAAAGSMPGMELKIIEPGTATLEEITDPLSELDAIGAVTGIPSFRETGLSQKGILQTLDQLAFGIRDAYGEERDYAMLVIADPIGDEEIAEIISRHRRLSSQIHSAVRQNVNVSRSSGESYDPNEKQKAKSKLIGSGLGAVIGGVAGAMLGVPATMTASAGAKFGGAIMTLIGAQLGSSVGASVASFAPGGSNRTVQDGVSIGVGREFLDKFAEVAEETCEHQIRRLNDGRNFGFWNAGVYVLGSRPTDVRTLTGMLRSIYSGEETYYEPIRLHLFRQDSGAMEIVRGHFDLVPLLNADIVDSREGYRLDEEEWHLFGRRYQYLSTPINTKELALATSLPRRDVPGLRFVKTAVRFANNPAEVGEKGITLGHIVDTGIEQSSSYQIDVNDLVRHVLVTGSTGSGKSTTCKRILSEVLRRDIPVMVIEPAKDDYVRWAMEYNRSLPEDQKDKRFRIFMPGVREFEGTPVEELALNLFEPGYQGYTPDELLQHTEIAATLLNSILPAEEVIPILIEETVHKTLTDWAEGADVDLMADEMAPLKEFPNIQDLCFEAEQVMRDKNRYSKENQGNLTEILNTRFQSLKRGMRGRILNVHRSTDYARLFSGNVIINISRFSGSKDKALIMSLLMQALYEYRISCYTKDADYRKLAQDNNLMHLLLVEEAHNVLLKPDGYVSSGSPQRAAADLFGNMLSEVRGYGQGFVVVDQVPTRLIDDAVKNTNLKIVHRLTAPDDQQLMASSMAFREDQKYIIPALEPGNAIICGDRDDASAWLRIPDPEV